MFVSADGDSPDMQISEHIERLVTLLKGEEPADSSELEEGADPSGVEKGLLIEPATATTSTPMDQKVGQKVDVDVDDEDSKIVEV